MRGRVRAVDPAGEVVHPGHIRGVLVGEVCHRQDPLVQRMLLEHLGIVDDDFGRVVLHVLVRDEPHVGGELVRGVLMASRRREVVDGDEGVAEFMVGRSDLGVYR